jgi:hypothetical protein
MSSQTIKGIPYGIADYGIIRRENYYYVDKTPYLERIQEAGRYLFFIRPRRFGKSLFVSVMEAFFDVLHRQRFDDLFKGTWIYDHPGDERGKYLVLSLNFTAVDSAADNVETSFLKYIQGAALSFMRKYADYLLLDREYFVKTVKESRSPSDIVAAIVRLCRDSGQKLYVIIDEYDNFANTILSTAGKGAYQKLTHGEGFFRSFFNVLKSGTSGLDAPITRLFLTGVSPITLDDVTSGYNIGKNVSLEPDFSRMLGFTRQDVADMIEYYRQAGKVHHQTDELMAILEEWYDHYLFCEEDDIRLFNADMVLYFFDHYLTRQKLPADLVDRNVRIDYGKLRYLILTDSGRGQKRAVNGNFERLKEILEQDRTTAKLEKGFSLDEIMNTDNFVSLLFYFGLLTIDGVDKDRLVLKIPNETIKRLYYDYIKKGYRETDIFDLDLSQYSDLISDMAYEGKWQPFFDYITGLMRDSLSLRDLISGEKSIQAFLNVYLGLSNLFIIHAERELNKGYADLLMEPFLAGYEGIKYSYLLEIKTVKAGERAGSPRLQKLKREAAAQLKQYSLDKRLKRSMACTTLIRLVLIFSGHEPLYIGEVGQFTDF